VVTIASTGYTLANPQVLRTVTVQAGVQVPATLQFYHSKGCEACNGLGYKGRIGVYEVIEVNDRLRELILKEPSIIEIKKAARKNKKR
jgi:type II secretory ATPase GspE/PulE/Tfp pilus assembly ATPase PilB-like protein